MKNIQNLNVYKKCYINFGRQTPPPLKTVMFLHKWVFCSFLRKYYFFEKICFIIKHLLPWCMYVVATKVAQGWGTARHRWGNGPWCFRDLHPSPRVKLRALQDTVIHVKCAVGGIHQSETAPFSWVASLLSTKPDRERTNHVSPNFVCYNHRRSFGTRGTVEIREIWKVVGWHFGLNFGRLMNQSKLHLYRPECSCSNLEI